MNKAVHAAAHLAHHLDEASLRHIHYLLYYAQGCHLALHREPLFDDPLETGPDGPMIRSIWPVRQRGRRLKTPWPDAETLNESRRTLPRDAIEVLNSVAAVLGDWSAEALAESIRRESPWLSARGDQPPEAHGSAALDPISIRNIFEPVCLPSRRELARDEPSPAAWELYFHFEHIRAFTPATIASEDAEAWFEALEAPPRDLPDLRKFLAS